MTRLKQYLMKASFASESDKLAALACLDDMERKLDGAEANRCENCGGSVIMSYNPNLNPNSFPGAASAKCSRCAGSGIDADVKTIRKMVEDRKAVDEYMKGAQ